MEVLAPFVIPSEFRPVSRLGAPSQREWKASLSDSTEIVVEEVNGKPCMTGIEKAISIVHGRVYLEARARQLLAPLVNAGGSWRLTLIDFGIDAQHQDCEFLMCFTFQATTPIPKAANPYVEIGFALPVRSSIGPMFVVTIQTVEGIST